MSTHQPRIASRIVRFASLDNCWLKECEDSKSCPFGQIFPGSGYAQHGRRTTYLQAREQQQLTGFHFHQHGRKKI